MVGREMMRWVLIISVLVPREGSSVTLSSHAWVLPIIKVPSDSAHAIFREPISHECGRETNLFRHAIYSMGGMVWVKSLRLRGWPSHRQI